MNKILKQILIPLVITIPLFIGGMLLLEKLDVIIILAFPFLILCCILAIVIQEVIKKRDALVSGEEQ